MNSVLREVDRVLDREDRVGVGRVEHLQPQAVRDLAERAPDHLGTERGSAHPEQHRVGVALGAELLGERVQLRSVLEHRLRTRQPAETVLDLRDAGPAPQRRVAAPDPLRDVLAHRAA